jgi:hypothetical protein
VLVKEILPKLKLGSSVAEHDSALARYFIETETFRALIQGECDIIAGDKGTGKTALYRILQERYAKLEETRDVEVIAAFNPAGSPVFQRLTEGKPLEEGQYVGLWKAYFLALAANWVLEIYEGAFTSKMDELDDLLRKTGLRSADSTANTVFSQVANLFRRYTRLEAAEMTIAMTPQGLPIITPRVEFAAGEVEEKPEVVEHDKALTLLEEVLTETGYAVWLVLDRLDEAFVGFPEAEIPALRALFRTYLDLQAFKQLRLKLFVRRDLFRRIIRGGFVNLTHVNARKVEIVWDDEDLFDLLCRRIEENHDLIKNLGLEGRPREEAFESVFPDQVDPGGRRPTTWNWMLSRIRDGNGIAPPRNLIDLVSKAQDAQQRREAREDREYVPGDALIGGDALKRGLSALSSERVEDTLLAEAGDYADLIAVFRDGKAEHNAASLGELLGASADSAADAAKPLIDIGFLEQTGDTFKVPMLYRDGMNITQGKAFEPADNAVDAVVADDPSSK